MQFWNRLVGSDPDTEFPKVQKVDTPIRVGFLIGKDNDPVEDAKFIGDTSFLSDLPAGLRMQQFSNRYDFNETRHGLADDFCMFASAVLMPAKAHVDVAIPWYIQKSYPDIEVDFIHPDSISDERLQSNHCNFIIGYDLINAVFEGPKKADLVREVFKNSTNLLPTWEVQDFIYNKSQYLQACIDVGIPVAPSFFAQRGNRSPEQVLVEVERRGWESFVLKLSFSAFSLGFLRTSLSECIANHAILENYFNDHEDCPEFVIQEMIPGFSQNWETRCFWFNNDFLYAVANVAEVSSANGEEIIAVGDDIPSEFLEAAKNIGRRALDILPQMVDAKHRKIGMTLIRTDIGCSEGPLHDKSCRWNPNVKTFFLNEIEYGGTNYFAKHLKFDCIPLWAKKYVSKVREIMS
eukprot:gnl/MRDRNA2_/MRDRNA2_26623_c0_seq1.p1 gnl/MRDRNA2_/MRDRNA2_26623_c0~~gnl/MRDRNA2_/MRDRNA2_26623_c0_seq1.p1  ORF type:complete len:406 (-),score=68.67 gnl/MRDRNA2_/MRDRNA2_26623_c0_seq1:80-1297(-)